MAGHLPHRGLDVATDEALEAARTMPRRQEDGRLKKGRTAAQCGRCRRDFLREAWQATEVRPELKGIFCIRAHFRY